MTDLAVVSARRPLRVDELTPGESVIHDALPGDHARRRWRLGRQAMRAALTVAGLDTDTSAITFPHRRLSLTYAAGEAVALATLTDVPDLCGVGIDREERWAPPPPRSAARFFLTPAEIIWLEGLPTRGVSGALVRLWTVKEAVFKADPGNADRQLHHYSLDDPAARHGSAASMVDQTSFHYRSQVVSAGRVVETVTVAQQPTSRRSGNL